MALFIDLMSREASFCSLCCLRHHRKSLFNLNSLSAPQVAAAPSWVEWPLAPTALHPHLLQPPAHFSPPDVLQLSCLVHGLSLLLEWKLRKSRSPWNYSWHIVDTWCMFIVGGRKKESFFFPFRCLKTSISWGGISVD